MSDTYNADGSTNGDDVGLAVDCLDHPASKDLKAYALLAALIQERRPRCSGRSWPGGKRRVRCGRRRRPERSGRPRRLGHLPYWWSGTTHDPATPYQWAVNLSHELSQGVLLTRDGSDHVAYFYSSCVRSYVQTYLVTLATPPTGTVCSD